MKTLGQGPRTSRGRRLLRSALLVTLVAALSVTAPASAADPKNRECARPDSWVAGTTNLCRGAIVYNDYVFDDHGADTGAPLTNRIGNLSPTAGDELYPVGEEGTADLIRLTLKPHGKRLRVKGLMSALYEKNSTVLAVAIDTDDDRSTGGGKWGDLGVSSSGWEHVSFLKRGNLGSNTIRGSIPLPRSKRWRIQAVTASAASGTVRNVAFRGPDERSRFGESATTPGTAVGAWFEDEQSTALAAGDVTRFGKTIVRNNLMRRKTRVATVASGFHERVYRSDYVLPPGEGVSYDGIPGRGDGGAGVQLGFEQAFNFLGHYQPYGIYIPERKGPHGIQMLFHGSGANLASLVGQPGMQARFGEELNRILVTPEGRGTEGWGSDISERDQLDVIRDVMGTYDVDRKKVFAGGYSQGGYSTYRFASLHPDLFAGASDWVGFTGDAANGNPAGTHYTGGAVGNAVDLIPNLLNVPTVMLYAGADELVQANQAVAIDAAFAATDNRYRYYFHPGAEHLTFAGLDDWRKEAKYTEGLELDRNPSRVVFGTAPFLDAPQYGLVHDRAYWVSKLRTSGGEKDYGTVDLTTAGCGGDVPALATATDAGSDPVPWTSDEQSIASTTPLDSEPRLTGNLDGVSAVAIDVRRACLKGGPIEFELTSDGPATISFSDGRELKLEGAGTVAGTIPR